MQFPVSGSRYLVSGLEQRPFLERSFDFFVESMT